MKSQKGITLTSLAIYIVIIFVVLAILATITTNIQSGVRNSGQEGIEIAEINKFNIFFLQEVKKQGNKIQLVNDNRIEFTSGNSYLFEDESIKIDDGENVIEIASNIDSCTFNSKIENEKTVITVIIKPKNVSEPVVNEYVLTQEELNYNYENEEDYIK